MTTPLTMEQFNKTLPAKVKKSMNQQLLDQINNTIMDPIVMESYRENLLGFSHVMKEGKFKMESYIDAVRYVSYKMMGDTNIGAYVKTFPSRYQTFLNNNTSDKDIASYVTSYNKNKLVNLVYEQTLIPTHVLNADIFQKAINTQAELMMTANSEKVRSDAANSLLTHLKAPETKKVELDIAVSEGSAISELRATTQALSDTLKQGIQSGTLNAKEAAHSKLVIDVEDAEIVE